MWSCPFVLQAHGITTNHRNDIQNCKIKDYRQELKYAPILSVSTQTDQTDVVMACGGEGALVVLHWLNYVIQTMSVLKVE